MNNLILNCCLPSSTYQTYGEGQTGEENECINSERWKNAIDGRPADHIMSVFVTDYIMCRNQITYLYYYIFYFVYTHLH